MVAGRNRSLATPERPADAAGCASTGWYREIGEIIGDLGSPRLPESLVRGLGRLVPFKFAVIFIYRGRSRPINVFDNFEPAEAKQGIAAYVEDTYVLNPFYQAYLRGLRDGVYRIRDLAPDAFFESEYYKSYRVLPRDSEEIGYLTEHWPKGMEEIDIAVILEGDVVSEISLYRPLRERGFSDAELALLSDVIPVIAALLRRHWAEFGAAGCGPPAPDSQVDDAFASFGRAVLTEREREVIQLILRGHSSRSICFHLGISLGTVKTHRKNAYAKLRISSQSELLSLFLRSLEASAPGTMES